MNMKEWDKKRKKGCFIPLPSPEDARNVFHVREHLEGLAAATAARYADKDDITFLKSIIEKETELNSSVIQNEKMTNATINEKFHLGIEKILDEWLKGG